VWYLTSPGRAPPLEQRQAPGAQCWSAHCDCRRRAWCRGVRLCLQSQDFSLTLAPSHSHACTNTNSLSSSSLPPSLPIAFRLFRPPLSPSARGSLMLSSSSSCVLPPSGEHHRYLLCACQHTLQGQGVDWRKRRQGYAPISANATAPFSPAEAA
jgi:hypothetical protein